MMARAKKFLFTEMPAIEVAVTAPLVDPEESGLSTSDSESEWPSSGLLRFSRRPKAARGRGEEYGREFIADSRAFQRAITELKAGG